MAESFSQLPARGRPQGLTIVPYHLERVSKDWVMAGRQRRARSTLHLRQRLPSSGSQRTGGPPPTAPELSPAPRAAGWCPRSLVRVGKGPRCRPSELEMRAEPHEVDGPAVLVVSGIHDVLVVAAQAQAVGELEVVEGFHNQLRPVTE